MTADWLQFSRHHCRIQVLMIVVDFPLITAQMCCDRCGLGRAWTIFGRRNFGQESLRNKDEAWAEAKDHC